ARLPSSRQCRLEPEEVALLERAVDEPGLDVLRPPGALLAVGGDRGVEAQPRDHGVGVTRVGEDGDPRAPALLTPAGEGAGVLGGLEDGGALRAEHIADSAGPVVTARAPATVTTAGAVAGVVDAVGGGDRVLDLLR